MGIRHFFTHPRTVQASIRRSFSPSASALLWAKLENNHLQDRYLFQHTQRFSVYMNNALAPSAPLCCRYPSPFVVRYSEDWINSIVFVVELDKCLHALNQKNPSHGYCLTEQINALVDFIFESISALPRSSRAKAQPILQRTHRPVQKHRRSTQRHHPSLFLDIACE
jgi:hypothetical protein